MKKILLILLVFTMLISCNTSNQIATSETEEQLGVYQKISAEDAKDMMTEDVVVLDVRTSEEYAQGHIEGSILLPLDSILNGDTQVLEDFSQTILVYCRSGNRSKVAAEALIELGYESVYDFGGILNWPYEIVE